MDIKEIIAKELRNAFTILSETTKYKASDIGTDKLFIIADYLDHDLKAVDTVCGIPILITTHGSHFPYIYAMRDPSKLELRYLKALKEVQENPEYFKED